MASLLDSINTIKMVFYQWAQCHDGNSFTLSQREAKKLIHEEFGEDMEDLCNSQALDLLSEQVVSKTEDLVDFNSYLDLIFSMAKACSNYLEDQECCLTREEETVSLRQEERADAQRRRASTPLPVEVSERRDGLPWESAHELELSNRRGRSRLIQDSRQLEANCESRCCEDRFLSETDEPRSRDLTQAEESRRGPPPRPCQFQEGDEGEQYSQQCPRRRSDLERYNNSEPQGREQRRSQEHRTPLRDSLRRRQVPNEALERDNESQRSQVRCSEPQEGERRISQQEPVMRNAEQGSQRYSESEFLEEEFTQKPAEARGRTLREIGQRMERSSEAQCLERVDERRRSRVFSEGPRRPLERDADRRRSLRGEATRRDINQERRQAYETEYTGDESERGDGFQVQEQELRGDSPRQRCRGPQRWRRDGENRRAQSFAASLREGVPRQQQQYCGHGCVEGRRQPRRDQHVDRESQEDQWGRIQRHDPLWREQVQGRQRCSESEDLGGQCARRPQLYEADAGDGGRRSEITSQH